MEQFKKHPLTDQQNKMDSPKTQIKTSLSATVRADYYRYKPDHKKVRIHFTLPAKPNLVIVSDA